MPETIVEGMWRWQDVLYDLVEQGELKKDDIKTDPFSVRSHSCGGTYKGKIFWLSWVHDELLLLSMKNDDNDLKQLAEGFVKIVDYNPFCKYISTNGLATYEWDKKNPKGRYQELVDKGVKSLTLLA